MINTIENETARIRIYSEVINGAEWFGVVVEIHRLGIAMAQVQRFNGLSMAQVMGMIDLFSRMT